jgi:hypothetical protein
MKVVTIVEGHGDLSAIPRLLSRTGELFNEQIIAANPIRSGGVHILRREGELERFVRMALSRSEVDLVLVAVDLDDGCAAQMAAEFRQRIAQMGLLDPALVQVCFFVREYECLFLAGLDGLRHSAPDYQWDQDYVCEDPEAHRGAKGIIDRLISRKYKEITDQAAMTGRVDLREVFAKSRSFRKLVRCLTGFEYSEIDTLLAA